MRKLVRQELWLGCLLLITALVAGSGTAEAVTCNQGETVEDCAKRECNCPKPCDFACLENTSCSTSCNETHINPVGVENDYECHCHETTCRIAGSVPCDDDGGGDSGSGSGDGNGDNDDGSGGGNEGPCVLKCYLVGQQQRRGNEVWDVQWCRSENSIGNSCAEGGYGPWTFRCYGRVQNWGWEGSVLGIDYPNRSTCP